MVEIASSHNKTPAQILLRYLLEIGVSTIPKSTNENRLKSNIDLFDFELTTQDRENLASLDANIRICDFAFLKGIERHQEFPFQQMKY